MSGELYKSFYKFTLIPLFWLVLPDADFDCILQMSSYTSWVLSSSLDLSLYGSSLALPYIG